MSVALPQMSRHDAAFYFHRSSKREVGVVPTSLLAANWPISRV